MPHATEDEKMGDVDELGAISRFVGGYGEGGEASDFATRDFDQSHKAANAVDYEDISDEDDLPDEEEATNGAESGELESTGDQISDGLAGQAAFNGFRDTQEQSVDVSGDVDEFNDLFGDRNSSPETERHPQVHAQLQRPVGLLALPSKSSLALPTQSFVNKSPNGRSVQHSSSPQSPPQYQTQDYSVLSPESMTSDDEDDEGVDINVALQRRLFREARKRAAGEDVLAGAVETDMDLFYTLYPGYEEYQAPRFIELFPPRNGFYKGKVPIKPPKPVAPTKLSLDLLQDQERSFKSLGATHKSGQDSSYLSSFINLGRKTAPGDHDDDLIAESLGDGDERIGNVTMEDLALICEDWAVPSVDSVSPVIRSPSATTSDGGWDTEERGRPFKKRKTEFLNFGTASSANDWYFAFEDPERAVAKVSETVALDLNDPHLLVDEHAPRLPKRRIKRMPGDVKRDNTLSRDLAKRYNVSNDQAYDLLKENHQHKIRSTLGSMAVEHSLPAHRLQFPFYRVSLDSKAKRAFHRPHLDLKNQVGREYRFQKPKYVKKKNWRGREAKEVYAKAEDLSFGDNATSLLLEYSEEAPMMMSNFGMGNRLINYYRKKNADDQERPKRDVGETQVLLTQDKSPFANFGHVDRGEVVPTLQNGLYRAPVFNHQAKSSDFLIGISSTYENGDRLFLRNVENLHVVGQQFPIKEVPGQHSRKVTDASKKRLKALSYRIYNKSLTRKDKILNNATLMPHLPGHDMPQTRSKMREFMRYEKTSAKSETTGVWVPKIGELVPDEDTMQSWIRPEDICLLDSMQVGVQHLADLGISETKEADEDKDIDDTTGASLEQQLAPWRATKNFINATQGKAMLSLYGDGDPTGCGLGFNFIKTSMKGGFVAQGESIADKLDKRRLKENGGHSYNVAKQQDAYDKAIRGIWNAQKESLESKMEASDNEIEDDPENTYANGRATTPRSSVAGTPGPLGRIDDDFTSQFSGHSAARGGQVMVIRRSGGRNAYGEEQFTNETVTNPRVIALYKKRVLEGRTATQSLDQLVPTGDAELDAHNRQKLEQELLRIKRNAERREAREKAKAKQTVGSVSAAGSPAPSDADGPSSMLNGSTTGTPQKGKGRNKDGTQRKCANCGQVGHIKTNRKLCPLLNGTMQPEDAGANGDSSFGAVPAPLTL